MANKFHFERVLANLNRAKVELPLILANEAKNEFLDNFRQQGYNGKPWKEVQRRTPGTPAYKYPKDKDPGRRTRNILQGKGSGRLRRDVANSVEAGRQTQTGYVLVVKNEYAEYHNEGAEHLPQRRFVGTTPALKKKLKAAILRYINRIWQKN